MANADNNQQFDPATQPTPCCIFSASVQFLETMSRDTKVQSPQNDAIAILSLIQEISRLPPKGAYTSLLRCNGGFLPVHNRLWLNQVRIHLGR